MQGSGSCNLELASLRNYVNELAAILRPGPGGCPIARTKFLVKDMS